MKKWFHLIFACSAAALLSSCLTMPGPDPARQAALEARFEAKSNTYPSKGKFKAPAAWAVGQYVVSGTTTDGRRQSISRMAIVGKENNGFIIEMSNSDARSESAQQMLVRGIDQVAAGKAKPETIEILWIKTRDANGQVQKMEGPMLNMMAIPIRNTFAQMYADQSAIVSSDGGSIRVPAGTFSGTTKTDAEVKIFGMTVKSTTHSHPSVPINGMVRSETSDGKSVIELLDFGLQGATSSF